MTTKLKRVLRFDNNVFVVRNSVGGGYSEIKRWNLPLIRASGIDDIIDCIFGISGVSLVEKEVSCLVAQMYLYALSN